ncbi:MAG: hypothetical protein ACM3PZ_01410 [Bacillota bacterium]
MGKDQNEGSLGQGLGLSMALLKAMAAAAKKNDLNFGEIQKIIENDRIVYEAIDRMVAELKQPVVINEGRRSIIEPTRGNNESFSKLFVSSDDVNSWLRANHPPTVATRILMTDLGRNLSSLEKYLDRHTVEPQPEKFAFTPDQIMLIWEKYLKGYLKDDARALILTKYEESYRYIELRIKDMNPHARMLGLPSDFTNNFNSVFICPHFRFFGIDKMVRIWKQNIPIPKQPEHSRVNEFGHVWLHVDENFNMSECKPSTLTDAADTYYLIKNSYSWAEIFYDINPDFKEIALTINEALALNEELKYNDYPMAYLIEQNDKFFVLECKHSLGNIKTGKIWKLSEGGALNVNGNHKIITRDNFLPF